MDKLNATIRLALLTVRCTMYVSNEFGVIFYVYGNLTTLYARPMISINVISVHISSDKPLLIYVSTEEILYLFIYYFILFVHDAHAFYCFNQRQFI